MNAFNASALEKNQLTLGFIPLTDCAPLVIAREHGYFEKYGLDVTLSKETSWANIRDKVALGILDGAQMLAPMPIAMSLGIGAMAKPMVTAFSMDLNGNGITVSNRLYERMIEVEPSLANQRPVTAAALKKVVDADRAAGRPPLTFAMVFPYSSHNYQLRYWLAAAGIDPDHDINLQVVPPPQMVGQLERGLIDGYCVGEPWNTVAVRRGIGHLLISSYEIWNNGPEKVFGVTQEWAEQYPHTHRALLMALLEASRWLDQSANRVEAAGLIAKSIYVNAPEHEVRMALAGTVQYSASELAQTVPDFNVFFRYAANYPWRSHALWLISQMVRWGQLTTAVDLRACAESVYRPDLYREAAANLGIGAPVIEYKTEGHHAVAWNLPQGDGVLRLGADRFFDGAAFDPADPIGYLRSVPVQQIACDLDALQSLNPIDQTATTQSLQPIA